MAKKQPSVFVIAEQSRKGIQPVSMQLIGKARQLAGSQDSGVEVILLGHGLEGSSQMLIEAGADTVFQGDSTLFVPYQAELYTDVIVRIIAEHHPSILLLGSTFMGRELAPLIAAKLETGLTAHCIELSINPEGILEQRIPAYGGMITIVCPEKRPQMATVANGVFSNPVLDSTRTGEIIPVEIPGDFPLRARTLEIVREESEGVSLDAASVIIAGGAGAGDLDGWSQIAELAKLLKAGFGSTRPAVDAGWTELDTMIGQSGKMVNPEIYIGVGVSGELQHMVGIVGAKIMIAINNDAKAPVFEQVDYGVVEDCRVFVPALVKALNNHEAYAVRATHAN
jgi:electron transfer flavoprotein alpha subunit